MTYRPPKTALCLISNNFIDNWFGCCPHIYWIYICLYLVNFFVYLFPRRDIHRAISKFLFVSFSRFLLSLTYVYLRYRLSAIACRQPLVEYASLYLIREITATRRQKDRLKAETVHRIYPFHAQYVHEICIQCIKQLPIDRL